MLLPSSILHPLSLRRWTPSEYEKQKDSSGKYADAYEVRRGKSSVKVLRWVIAPE
jgi:P2-related tail formation protein